jgi:hypothetical protein
MKGNRQDRQKGSFSMSVNIPLALANIQYQTLGLLLDRDTTASANDATGSSFLDMLNSLGGIGGSDTSLDATGLLSTGATSSLDNLFGDGSNLLLQAFNARETSYSKELSRLEGMQDDVADLSTTAKSLQTVTADSSSSDDIKAALQNFVRQYNAWDTEFDADVATGGDLQDSQPANMARFSMLRDVNDIFNGRGNGGLDNGMSALGIEVGTDGQIAFDTTKFDQAMATDKTAAVKTINNMAQSLSRDADSLVSDGTPLTNRIDRLEDALGFIDENKPSIEAQASAAAMYQSMLRL